MLEIIRHFAWVFGLLAVSACDTRNDSQKFVDEFMLRARGFSPGEHANNEQIRQFVTVGVPDRNTATEEARVIEIPFRVCRIERVNKVDAGVRTCEQFKKMLRRRVGRGEFDRRDRRERLMFLGRLAGAIGCGIATAA